MASAKFEYSRVFVAAFISIFTLAIFYNLQDYGPQNAIRRFHTALEHNDALGLQAVTEEKLDSPVLQRLILLLKSDLPMSKQPEIARMERSKDEVRVAVVYTMPTGEPAAVIWVVDKTDGLWKISATKTLRILSNGAPA